MNFKISRSSDILINNPSVVQAIGNNNLSATSAREIAAILGYAFFNGTSTLKIFVPLGRFCSISLELRYFVQKTFNFLQFFYLPHRFLANCAESCVIYRIYRFPLPISSRIQ